MLLRDFCRRNQIHHRLLAVALVAALPLAATAANSKSYVVPATPEERQALARAAEAGEPDALYLVGALGIEGKVQGVSRAQGLSALSRAADAGHAEANYLLGVIYATGQGQPRDPQAAARHLQVAANAGHADAQAALGQAYLAGQGVPQDAAQAKHWLEQAAAQGDSEARINLGVLLTSGGPGVADPARGVELLRAAADQGAATAQHNLGQIYAERLGVPAHPQTAYGWYLRSRTRYQRAQLGLGRLLLQGSSLFDPAEGAA